MRAAWTRTPQSTWAHGVVGQVRGVAGQVRGVAGQVRGMAGQVRGVADQVRGVADQVRGVAGQVRGVGGAWGGRPIAWGCRLVEGAAEYWVDNQRCHQQRGDEPRCARSRERAHDEPVRRGAAEQHERQVVQQLQVWVYSLLAYSLLY